MSAYQVTITAPDGTTRDLRIPAEQVEFFRTDIKDPFATVAYLAYCDLWTQA